jgi:hypothetical protein
VTLHYGHFAAPVYMLITSMRTLLQHIDSLVKLSCVHQITALIKRPTVRHDIGEWGNTLCVECIARCDALQERCHACAADIAVPHMVPAGVESIEHTKVVIVAQQNVQPSQPTWSSVVLLCSGDKARAVNRCSGDGARRPSRNTQHA